VLLHRFSVPVLRPSCGLIKYLNMTINVTGVVQRKAYQLSALCFKRLLYS
jgi:hypothetical protein